MLPEPPPPPVPTTRRVRDEEDGFAYDDVSLHGGTGTSVNRDDVGESGSGAARILANTFVCDKVSRGMCCSSGNLRALWGFLLMNTAYAAAQLIGAVHANSLTMFSDSGSMLVDSLTYAINIKVEKTKVRYGVEKSRKCEGITSLISVGALIIVTVLALVNAINRMADVNREDADVDGKIVIGFAIGNLVLDVFMCGNFCFQVKEKWNASKLTTKQLLSDELNMLTAFAHVFADTLRTISGLVAGALEAQTPDKAVQIDATATFVVCGTIIGAAAILAREALVALVCKRTQPQTDGIEMNASDEPTSTFLEHDERRIVTR